MSTPRRTGQSTGDGVDEESSYSVPSGGQMMVWMRTVRQCTEWRTGGEVRTRGRVCVGDGRVNLMGNELMLTKEHK